MTSAEAPGPAGLPELVAARGETGLAERIVAELGVTTDPGAAVDAGAMAYLRHLVASLVRAVLERFYGLLDAVPLPAGWSRVVAWAVALAALALVALVVVRALRRRRPRPAEVAAAPEVVAGSGEPVAADRDAAGWRAELEALLAAGRVREALRALWWWLARSLAGPDADPAWTGRELLERSGRRDLLPLVRRLEALTYGRSQPAPSDLRGVTAEIEGTLS